MVWYDMTRFAHLMFPLARFCCRLQREPLQRQAKSCSGWSSYVQSVKISVKVMHHRAMLYCCYCYYYYYFYLIICTYIYTHVYHCYLWFSFPLAMPKTRYRYHGRLRCQFQRITGNEELQRLELFWQFEHPGHPGLRWHDVSTTKLSTGQHAAACGSISWSWTGCCRLLQVAGLFLWNLVNQDGSLNQTLSNWGSQLKGGRPANQHWEWGRLLRPA
jgi:hypothetical protein